MSSRQWSAVEVPPREPDDRPPPIVRPFLAGAANRPATESPAAASEPGASPVRPYLLTGGRAGSSGTTIEIEAQVVITPAGEAALSRHVYEHHAILAWCRQPAAVAELAAALGMHLNVVRVLVGDLVAIGHLAVRRPESGTHRDAAIIERVIRGLQAIR
jgi:hypothetical protein